MYENAKTQQIGPYKKGLTKK